MCQGKDIMFRVLGIYNFAHRENILIQNYTSFVDVFAYLSYQRFPLCIFISANAFIMIFFLLVSWTIAVVLSVLGFLTILAVILCICYCLKNKNKKKQHAFGIKKNYFKVFPKYIHNHRSLLSIV